MRLLLWLFRCYGAYRTKITHYAFIGCNGNNRFACAVRNKCLYNPLCVVVIERKSYASQNIIEGKDRVVVDS